jgi:TonB family protein
MTAITAVRSRSQIAIDEVGSLGIGLLITAGLFTAIAFFERPASERPEPLIEDLRSISVPFDTPPPKPIETSTAPEAPATPLSGIEIASTESPVKITVLPPELDALVPSTDQPLAVLQPLSVDSRPKGQLASLGESNRIYQSSEVDRPPTVLSRPNPRVPSFVRQNAISLRVSMLALIDKEGVVTDVRLLESSGNPMFDKIIMRDVKDYWVFSPAVKNKKNVRCLAQQSVRVKWEGGDLFEAR